jgi:2Fe-2S ferredoxin
MYTIRVEFQSNEKDNLSLQKIHAGQSLLEVCLNHGIELPHECGGICSCSTCYVYIENGAGFLEPPSKREEHLLQKAGKNKTGSRLACQCLLLNGKGEIIFTIPF